MQDPKPLVWSSLATNQGTLYLLDIGDFYIIKYTSCFEDIDITLGMGLLHGTEHFTYYCIPKHDLAELESNKYLPGFPSRAYFGVVAFQPIEGQPLAKADYHEAERALLRQAISTLNDQILVYFNMLTSMVDLKNQNYF